MDYTLPIGAKLFGNKYVIERVIGIGGFGITYAAKHVQFDNTVAIKELFISGRSIRDNDHYTVQLQNIEVPKYEKMRKRFFDEAKTLMQLKNSHVVRVFDVFEENNTAYIVMDYVPGETLYQKIKREGPIPFQYAVNYIAQLSEAVEYIHNRHILHRDIKPDNVMVTPQEQVVLIDFGSAREFVNDEVQNHSIVLTQGYAPIEQYSSNSKKGNYTDIYALGGVFYFILTGQKPKESIARLTEDILSPKEINAAIPEDVNYTIMKAMEMKPEDRYQCVQEMRKDLLGETMPVTTQEITYERTNLPKIEIEKTIKLKKQRNVFIFLFVFFFLSSCLFAYINSYTKKQLRWIEYELQVTEEDLEEARYDNKKLKDAFSNIPFVITDVKIGNTDKNRSIETNYGNKIYSSSTMFLQPKLFYVGITSGTQTIKTKLYKPNGELSKGKESPYDATQKREYYFSQGVNSIELFGWGGKDKGYWPSGKYRWEIWCGDKCVATKYFTIY